MTATLVPLADGSITSPQGFTAAAAAAGLKKDGAPDVAVVGMCCIDVLLNTGAK